ncbi:MAG: DUF1559 domain-containing protein [Planctomycetaceae bacterium]|nr:DUF1559 domain-containing protein [Planctomycetaceae bacterium]
MLPAVQAAREAARRMQCTNKLKQLGLAVHNYHDINQASPAGRCGPYGKETTAAINRYSIFVSILPFMELNSLYEQFMSTNLAAGASDNWFGFATTLSTTSPVVQNVPAYYCPSDAAGGTQPTNRHSGTNYRWCLGDNPSGQQGSINAGGFIDKGHNYLRGHRGIFGYYTFYNFSAVTDGLSNTLIFSERCLTMRMNVSSIKVRDASVSSTSNSSWAGDATNGRYLSSRKGCLDTAKGDEYIVAIAGTALGWGFSHGLFSTTSFTTVLPPNGPSCYYSADSWNAMIAPSSNHSGGVNATVGDGSVRFITQTIDTGPATNLTFSTIATGTIGEVTGKSPFGIWGALGSRDGGESVTF